MSPTKPNSPEISDPFACFHPVTAEWFKAVFDAPTAPQRMGWPVIARGENALILAPTGTGKTLAAFLWCLDRLMLQGRDQGQGSGIGKTGTEGPREQGNKEATTGKAAASFTSRRSKRWRWMWSGTCARRSPAWPTWRDAWAFRFTSR